MDNNEGIITLEDENGRMIDMNVIEMVEYEEVRYVLLQSTDENDENSYIFRFREDIEYDRLESIDDEEELERIWDIFEEKLTDGPVN
ncbi:MAG TPA: DUF1292 domain-containing protein [Clostridia bacterium]|nr:DUF1292 domain-containing protein [Clostridia bacterium]HPQ47846.1 DUF1292 domain-containing protein [Clostridia bacterium]HRX42045.1 DUF1292 domain-containing protein [Clostridia bacterium]